MSVNAFDFLREAYPACIDAQRAGMTLDLEFRGRGGDRSRIVPAGMVYIHPFQAFAWRLKGALLDNFDPYWDDLTKSLGGDVKGSRAKGDFFVGWYALQGGSSSWHMAGRMLRAHFVAVQP